jgi:hypothetical protein
MGVHLQQVTHEGQAMLGTSVDDAWPGGIS